ncbi:hypothetical protein ACFE04_028882 [Oxalis oulophora]
MAQSSSTQTPLQNRPGIFLVGSPTVGKRTILSRLLSVDFDDESNSSIELLGHGWTIKTKYYTADVSVWMSHLHDGFSVGNLPMFDQLAALVMVFDMNDLSTLTALQNWVSRTDIQNFDILLCIGNKVDLIRGHPVHGEYRRRLEKLGDYSVDPFGDYNEYGISETEGSSLLGDGQEQPPLDIRKLCLEWCSQLNIEYIEACASNPNYDKCLSVDGDSQGVERLYGALSAHMWPGMVLKSGNKITEPSLPEKEESSDEESDFELEYEVLSAGSAWDDTEEWVSASGTHSNLENSSGTKSVGQNGASHNDDDDNDDKDKEHPQPSTSVQSEKDNGEVIYNEASENGNESDKDTPFDFEDMEQLMSEIGNVRSNLRLMPDFQRREMAAQLAMKMALMFGDASDGELDEIN